MIPECTSGLENLHNFFPKIKKLAKFSCRLLSNHAARLFPPARAKHSTALEVFLETRNKRFCKTNEGRVGVCAEKAGVRVCASAAIPAGRAQKKSRSQTPGDAPSLQTCARVVGGGCGLRLACQTLACKLGARTFQSLFPGGHSRSPVQLRGSPSARRPHSPGARRKSRWDSAVLVRSPAHLSFQQHAALPRSLPAPRVSTGSLGLLRSARVSRPALFLRTEIFALPRSLTAALSDSLSSPFCFGSLGCLVASSRTVSPKQGLACSSRCKHYSLRRVTT